MNKTNKSDIRAEIQRLFDENQLDDLKRFMRKRQCLNRCNVYMLYIFHVIQSAGILTSSIGASMNDQKLIWFGVGLNMVASVIQIYEKINDAQLKRILRDIQAIKDDTYVDESPIVDIEKDMSSANESHEKENNEAEINK
jgi:hypothetical protein